jgi:hypothetical protein
MSEICIPELVIDTQTLSPDPTLITVSSTFHHESDVSVTNIIVDGVVAIMPASSESETKKKCRKPMDCNAKVSKSKKDAVDNSVGFREEDDECDTRDRDQNKQQSIREGNVEGKCHNLLLTEEEGNNSSVLEFIDDLHWGELDWAILQESYSSLSETPKVITWQKSTRSTIVPGRDSHSSLILNL